jgi:hypothetical protein
VSATSFGQSMARLARFAVSAGGGELPHAPPEFDG